MDRSLKVGESAAAVVSQPSRGVVLRCRQARRRQGHEVKERLWLRKAHP